MVTSSNTRVPPRTSDMVDVRVFMTMRQRENSVLVTDGSELDSDHTLNT